MTDLKENSVKKLPDVLWVEVSDKYVYPKEGAEMPKEKSSGFSYFFGSIPSFGRAEFERWSGVKFPKGSGVYGLRVKLSTIERLREVVETELVAAKHTTRKLVRG